MPRASANHTGPQDRLVDHLPALRTMLEHQRQFRLEQLAELDALVENTVPTNAGDQARHEVAIKLAAAARHALADINGALALVATGGYGRCRNCHADIPLRLLRAIPATRICLRCRQATAQASRQFPGRAPHRKHSAQPYSRRRAETQALHDRPRQGGRNCRPCHPSTPHHPKKWLIRLKTVPSEKRQQRNDLTYIVIRYK